uniref:Reverse transcriptase n=1 Tax=Cacopsylla melanoneura TaxID=428564 RepID=A0A8D8WWH0_9HEMI
MNTSVCKPSFESVKRLVKSRSKENYNKWIRAESQGKKWQALVKNPDIIPNLPRKASVANFRLLTGHDYLSQHLHRIGIKDSPNCPLCPLNSPMNQSHLNSCPAMEASSTIEEKYWDARRKMV